MSHPAWVCGLKLLMITRTLSFVVTPCVGVWIETKSGHTITYDCGASHPAWVCGLKLGSLRRIHYGRCHTLRGCVD